MNSPRAFFLSTILFLLASIPFAANAQLVKGSQPGNGQKGYEVTGRIEGLKEGSKVIMRLIKTGWDTEDLIDRDSAVVKNGEFHITGVVPEGPRPYLMSFREGYHSYDLPLDINNNENIRITGPENINNWKHYYLQNWVQIEGSPTAKASLALGDMMRIWKQNIIQLNGYLKKIKDSIGFNASMVESVLKSKSIANNAYFYYLFHFIQPNLRPAIISSFIDSWYSGKYGSHSVYLQELYEKLDSSERNSYYGKLLKQYLPLCVGQTFPGFSLPTTEGNTISLKDMLSKSKVTLVHFWATNSFMREEYQQELLFLYRKYHEKGLNIIGVSADTEEYLWKGLLKTHPDQYPWINVSDLKGKDGVVEKVYHEYPVKIPNTTNYLLDNNGRILSYDPRGLELQWYLWKILGE